ncbi:TIGR04149 family rSAM-modified RiPP [Marinifilum sp. RC60d5]|uniref:TIGR04149 family rSAM-modified RiPP n=1 Tax=Marinifilum sp. RC60d5 TaxID=3458414 RepID=UPI0040354559
MKTLKLSKLENSVKLSEKQMSKMHGGASCTCGCFYADSGGSSTNANGNANAAGGLYSVFHLKQIVVKP